MPAGWRRWKRGRVPRRVGVSGRTGTAAMKNGHLLACCLLSAGCAVSPPPPIASPLALPPPVILPARHVEPAAAAPVPLAELTELSADAVVEQVLSRNPSLEQMAAALRAEEARYPQAT